MSRCPECGAERAPGTHFCITCGAAFEEPTEHERPGPGRSRTSASIGRGPGWYAGLAGGLAVLVIGVVFGVMGLIRVGPWAETAAVSSAITDPVTTSPPVSSTPSTPAVTTVPSTSPTPVVSPVGNDVVAVAAAAAADPLAAGAVDLLTAYFRSINDRDFVTYRSLHTADIRANLSLDKLAAGYRSTHDAEVQLVRIDRLPDGRLAAWTQFVSRQDAADGPDGQTCTQWSTAFFLQAGADGRWSIGTVPAGYHAAYNAC